MRILVSGLLNIETTVPVRGFPVSYYPIDYPFFGISSGVSGVGYNIAKALTVLGDDVELCSFLGRDEEGERVKRQLLSDGIASDRIFFSLRHTPVSAVLYDPSGRRQIYCDLKDIQEQSLCVDQPLSCDAAVLCNINFNRELIKKAKAQGVCCASDVHVLSDIDDAYNRDFMENADILFLSDEMIPCSPADFLRKLEERYHNRVIVLGRGEKGAMLLDREHSGVYQLSAVRCEKVVNTVGAGDALFSSFLHFYTKGASSLTALIKAQIFASKKITVSGASKGFCKEAEIEEAFSTLRVDVSEV